MRKPLIKDILKETSHEVVTAGDGEEAEKRVRDEAVDMVILDVIMPKKNGFQVCRDLRMNRQFKDIPIIMVTSKDQESDKAWGLKQGATEYLVKPFMPRRSVVLQKRWEPSAAHQRKLKGKEAVK